MPIVPSRAGRVRALVQKLASERPAERDSAVAQLTLLGPRAVEPLLAALSGASVETRLGVLEVLAHLDDHRVLPAVLTLADDPSRRVAVRAIELTARRPDPRSVPTLARSLATGPRPRRQAAAFALAALHAAGVVEALAPLVDTLVDEEAEPRLRISVLDGLLEMEPPLPRSTLRPIGRRLAASTAPTVAARAPDLDPVGKDRGSAPRSPGPVVERLRKGEAVEGASVEQRLDALERAQRPSAIQALARALGPDGGPASIPILSRALARLTESRDAEDLELRLSARAAVHSALAALDSRVALHDLRELVATRPTAVMPALLDAAARVGDASLVPALARAATEDPGLLPACAAVYAAIARREKLRRTSPSLRKVRSEHRPALEAFLGAARAEAPVKIAAPIRREALLVVAASVALVAFAYLLPPTFFEGTDWLQLHLPNKVHAAEALRGGRLPLWNPYVGLGRPFLADTETAVLYPPEPGLYVLARPVDRAPAPDGRPLRLGLVGMLALGRALGMARWATWLAAACFLWSAPLVARLSAGQVPYSHATCYLPLLFFLALRLQDAFSVARLAALAAALALQLRLRPPADRVGVLARRRRLPPGAGPPPRAAARSARHCGRRRPRLAPSPSPSPSPRRCSCRSSSSFPRATGPSPSVDASSERRHPRVVAVDLPRPARRRDGGCSSGRPTSTPACCRLVAGVAGAHAGVATATSAASSSPALAGGPGRCGHAHAGLRAPLPPGARPLELPHPRPCGGAGGVRADPGSGVVPLAAGLAATSRGDPRPRRRAGAGRAARLPADRAGPGGRSRAVPPRAARPGRRGGGPRRGHPAPPRGTRETGSPVHPRRRGPRRARPRHRSRTARVALPGAHRGRATGLQGSPGRQGSTRPAGCRPGRLCHPGSSATTPASSTSGRTSPDTTRSPWTACGSSLHEDLGLTPSLDENTYPSRQIYDAGPFPYDSMNLVAGWDPGKGNVVLRGPADADPRA